MEFTGRLLRALQFAADRHRDQRRKDIAQTPYINHPLDVACMIYEIGGVNNEDVLIAAMLHDTVEDTATTEAEIKKLFGPLVAQYVMEVTDDKTLPVSERKLLQVEHTPHLSQGAKLIKIADKSSNVRDIIHSPPIGWHTERCVGYLKWAQAVVEGARGINPGLEDHFDGILSRGKEVFVF